MANEKNLKPITSTSEARERGRKGGQASGRARRDKKAFKELAKTILSMQCSDDEMIGIAKAMGIENPSNKQMVVIGLTLSAIKGNHNAFDRLISLVEEDKPATDEQKKQTDLLNAIEKAVRDAD